MARYRRERFYIDERTGEACVSGGSQLSAKEEREQARHHAREYWASLPEYTRELITRLQSESHDDLRYLRGNIRNMWIQRFYNTLPGVDTSRSPGLAISTPLILAHYDTFKVFVLENTKRECDEYNAKWPQLKRS